jgi:hypothetical protein
MWSAGLDLIAHFQQEYGISFGAVIGHMEWSRTACPGRLMPRIVDYRSQQESIETPEPEPGRYIAVWPATVRTDHTVNGRYVLTLVRGHEVEIDAWVKGKDAAGRGVGWWAHWATGLGFIHQSALARIP